MDNEVKQKIDYISSLKVFDEEYYLSQFSVENRPDGNLLEHYYFRGWKDGKNPSTWFNTNYYLQKYKDIREAQVNPFFHYLNRGLIENRETGEQWLDISFYSFKYRDIIPEDMNPYTHYLTVGFEQGLMPSDKYDADSVLNKMYLKKGFKNLVELSCFIDKLAVKKKNGVDTDFYSYLYQDLADVSPDEIINHYLNHGKQKGRFSCFEELIESIGLDTKTLPIFNLTDFYRLNPLFSDLTLSQIYLKILQYNKIDLIRFSEDDTQVSTFYMQLGEYYLIKNHKNKAKQILLYANYIKPSYRANELLGNICMDANNYEQAKPYYLSALKLGGKSLWLFINTVSCLRHLKEFKQAQHFIIKALSNFAQHSYLLKLLDETIEQEWNALNTEYHILANLQHRHKLIDKVDKSVQTQVDTLNFALTAYNSEAPLQGPASLNRNKVHIIGDYHVPQCVRYRIDQKVEQLVHAGYEVTTSSWTDINKNELNLTDILIIYRAPALPNIVKAIIKAKLLGKIVIYEIDDLIFDPIYPADYSEYAGSVGIEEYSNLTHGMALFNAAAKLCDYAIASTLPLKEHLSALVTTGNAFLHRNGLDFYNTPIIEGRVTAQVSDINSIVNEEFTTLFYGSGTLAHNSDFIEIAIPAIENILNKHDKVCLMVVGHLTLPKDFLKRFDEQIIQIPKTKTIEEYWQYLELADINMAVLDINEINNCKSELKWFEAACFKTPSIVSATQNYIDVIDDYSDGILVRTSNDWFDALNSLIENEHLRDKIGQNAFEKVIEDYSINSLANNITNILNNIIENHEAKNG